MSKHNKVGPKPIKRNGVILAMREMKKCTSADLGVHTAYLDSLCRAGIARVVGKKETNKKGRPANIYALDKRGNGMATSLKRKMVTA